MIQGTWILGGVVLVASILRPLAAAPVSSSKAPATESTITSDELEIRNNGEMAFFRGHVVLTEHPYVLLADEMTREKKTGLVTSRGHLDGTWLSEKGEKVKAYGDEGLYTPKPPKTELWGVRPRLIRWESPTDTAPVEVVADRFVAYHEAREFFASGEVVVTQKPKILSRSDKAKYDQKEGVIHLYGPSRVYVHIADAKGTGDFYGDKGWVTLNPRTAHMSGNVKGHVDPGSPL